MDAADEQNFEESRALLIDDITKSLTRTTASLRVLNANLTEIQNRGERIATVSGAWVDMLSSSPQPSQPVASE